jgi:hypothetical protein
MRRIVKGRGSIAKFAGAAPDTSIDPAWRYVMKRKFIPRTAVALFAVATTGALQAPSAYADSGGSIWIGDARFADWMAAAAKTTPSPYDSGEFRKLNLSVIGNTLWVPKDGVQRKSPPADPALQEAARKVEADERLMRQRLGPVGGVNTA